MFSKLLNIIKENKVIFFIIAVVVMFNLFRLHNEYENFAKGTTEGSSSQVKNTKMLDISLSDLKSQFEKMKNEAKWDVNKPLYYGFYFYDKDKAKLEKFSKILQKDGLQTYKIEGSADFLSGSYLLYGYEKVVHSPSSLFDRCVKFSKLAVDNQIEEFDGWEAGESPL